MKNKLLRKTKKVESPRKPKVAIGVVYKVQLLTSSKKIALDPANFSGLKNVDEYISNGFYKYTIGQEKDYSAAKRLQDKAEAIGYDGAFVLAFENGERISLQEALLGAQRD